MTKNAIGALFFLAFSCFYFYNVFNIKKMPANPYEIMNAASFPFYIGITGIILSLLIFILSFKDKDKEFLQKSYLKSLDFKTTSYFVAAMIFYGYTIRTLGFMISTTLFLIIGFYLLKERNIKLVLLTSVGVAVGFYLLLNNVLGVYIDPGLIVEYFTGEES